MTLHRDQERGHFVLDLAPGEVVGADLGPRLSLSAAGAYLTPADARTLADALTWWADRQHEAVEDEDRVIELGDLLSLLEEREVSR